MTGKCSAVVAYHQNVSFPSVRAPVAGPVQLLSQTSLVLEFFGFYLVLLAVESVGSHLCSAVGTSGGIAEPLEQTFVAVGVAAGKVSPVAYYLQAYRALVLLDYLLAETFAFDFDRGGSRGGCGVLGR